MNKPVEQRGNVGTYATMRVGPLPEPQPAAPRADSKLSAEWKKFIGDGLKDR